MSALDARWPLAAPATAPRDACPAADTGVCLCADCVVARVRARLHAAVVEALHRADVGAWVGRCADGWIAEIDTDDGRIAVRCRARTPEDAAQLVVAVVTGSAP